MAMANSRGLLVIGVFLAVVHVFFTQPIHCAVHRKSVKRINSNWEKVDSAELGGSSSGIAANFDKTRVLTVAKEAGQGDFTTVQGAINAVPVHNKNPVVINVRPGIYREKVTIPAEKPFVRVSGSDANSTVISWNDSAKSSGGTYYSATVSVYASDFTARKITITNSYGPGKLTPEDQAVAVRISGDRSAFYDCRFLGYPDTVLDESGRHYFQNCYIEGAIDFVCGNGRSIYESCDLHAIPIDNGAFTAQKRSSLSDNTGFVFLHCTLTGNGLMFLGRAWAPYSTVLYAYTYMADIIVPKGWDNWNDPSRDKTAHYGQYKCCGAGASETKRVAWSHELSPTEAAPLITIDYIYGRSWIR